MSHAYHELFYHYAWGTPRRENTISREWRPRMLGFRDEAVRKFGGTPIRRNAMPDHAHLLVQRPPSVMVADFIGKVKGSVSYRVSQELPGQLKLAWQEGCGVVTLRKDELDHVGRYIDNQEAHHRTASLSEILERLGIAEG